jgi:hypothetical protein
MLPQDIGRRTRKRLDSPARHPQLPNCSTSLATFVLLALIVRLCGFRGNNAACLCVSSVKVNAP